MPVPTATAEPIATSDSDELEALLNSAPAAAVRKLRPLASGGNSGAQLFLGELLVNGVGTMRDPREAFHWFRAAARAQVPMAMNMVGRCYEHGLGTTVDYERAAEWYFRAATFDCDWAIYNYAQLLAGGRGVTRDRTAAFSWFRLAATRGHARAMNFLGQYYENGWETHVDRAAAFDWYRRSAEGGDFRGQCSHASVLADQGRIEEALHWLRLAVTTATHSYLAILATKLRDSPHPALRAFAVPLLPG